ncbi:unnamed protein product [Sphagnum balticum]
MTNELQQFENFIENDIVDPVKEFFTTNPTGEAIIADTKAFFANAEALVERNGGGLLMTAATTIVPEIVAGQWAGAVASVLALAKSAGAATVAAEEQLAASTALQIAQAAGNALTQTATTSVPASSAAPVEGSATTAS